MGAKRYRNLLSVFLAALVLGAACGGGNHQVQPCVISGTVTGAVSAGVTVTLSGAQTATATTDATGNYEFARLTSGDYAVTPSLPGYVFTPASTSITVNCIDVSKNPGALEFTASVAPVYWTHFSFACQKAIGNVCCFRHVGPGFDTVSCEASSACPQAGSFSSWPFTCPDMACQGDVCCYSKETKGVYLTPCWP